MGQAAERPIACQMAIKAVLNLVHSIHLKNEHCKFSPTAF
jgi:hypothetical protein